MEAREWFSSIYKHIKFCIAMTLVFALVAGIVAWGFLPDEYTCDVGIYSLPKQEHENILDEDADLSVDNVAWGLYHEMHASQQIANDIARLVKSDNIRDKVTHDAELDDLSGYSIDLDSSEKNRVSYFIVKGPDPDKVAAIADSASKHTAELAKQILEVESVTIFDEVKTPTEPSGPYRFLILGVAAGCGLFISLVLIFFKEALSNKIKDKDDLLSFTEISVFAEFPKV